MFDYTFFKIRSIFFFLSKSCIVSFIFLTLAHAEEAVKDPANVKTIKIIVPVSISATFEAIFRQIAADFSQKNPGIRIEVNPVSESFESLKKIISMNYAETPPDLAIINEADLAFLKKREFIKPFSKTIFQKMDFIKSLLTHSLPEKDLHYSLPFMRRTPAWYFNKELLFKLGLNPEHIPNNWTELSLYSSKFTPTGKQNAAMLGFSGIAIPSAGNTALSGWNSMGHPRFNGKLEPTLKWIEYMQKNKGNWVTSELRTQDLITLFMNQKAVVVLSTLDRHLFFKNKAPFKFGMIFPQGKEKVWFGLDLVATTEKGQSAEAKAFIEYLYGVKASLQLYGSSNSIPVRQLYLKDEEWKKQIQDWPELKKLITPTSNLNYLQPMNHHYISPQLRADFARIVWNAILNATPRAQTTQELEKLLSTDP